MSASSLELIQLTPRPFAKILPFSRAAHRNCAYLAQKKYCTSRKYYGYMKRNCKLTCEMCDNSPTSRLPSTTVQATTVRSTTAAPCNDKSK